MSEHEVLTQLEQALTRLAEAKTKAAHAKYQLDVLEAQEPLERARAEQRAIEAVGGDEKALGSNAESRARALRLALVNDETYQAHLELIDQARKRLLEAQAEYEEAKVEAEVARARVNLALRLSVEEVDNGKVPLVQ